ncbi:hypothetical protein [Chitinophaga agri]|uniref:Uncharacterized protein n=1 Tax=Chitinophaga agri TaxID=2703787 RepID=A0A6B9ZKG6_9BACT|nr:hypothetical protein [Chitinophaga agri]QHS62882.1 hypothetical protein GWR21_25855 [Chitinophaga agri]
MLRKNIPVYDVDHVSVCNQQDICLSRVAPYLAIHANLYLVHKHTFYQLFVQLIAESEMRRESGVDVINTQLLQLFYTISNIHLCSQDDIKHSQQHLLLNHFIKLMERRYNERRLPEPYAAQLDVMPNHLHAPEKFSRYIINAVRQERQYADERMQITGNLNFVYELPHY